ncbi:MAG: restriction endonuclease [Acetobacteraceae bacterium]
MMLLVLVVVFTTAATAAVAVTGSGVVQNSGVDLPWIVAGALAVLVLYPLFRGVGALAARYTLMRQVEAMVDRHLMALQRRRAQLVTLDAYGEPQPERWDREVDYFIARQVEPQLTKAEQRALVRTHDRVAALICRLVEAASDEPADAVSFTDDMTPAQYEQFCAEQLRRAGWTARVTMHSRDQGVDVIAEKETVRIVIQCKLYARPVGNRSVQEAAAGRAHEDADYALVVSNNRFTPAAEQLAATNGVLLLHHRDLPRLDAILSARS